MELFSSCLINLSDAFFCDSVTLLPKPKPAFLENLLRELAIGKRVGFRLRESRIVAPGAAFCKTVLSVTRL